MLDRIPRVSPGRSGTRAARTNGPSPGSNSRRTMNVHVPALLGQGSDAIQGAFQSFDNAALWVILGISLLALVVAYFFRAQVLREPEGTEKMRDIAKAIQEGS